MSLFANVEWNSCYLAREIITRDLCRNGPVCASFKPCVATWRKQERKKTWKNLSPLSVINRFHHRRCSLSLAVFYLKIIRHSYMRFSVCYFWRAISTSRVQPIDIVNTARADRLCISYFLFRNSKISAADDERTRVKKKTRDFFIAGSAFSRARCETFV